MEARYAGIAAARQGGGGDNPFSEAAEPQLAEGYREGVQMYFRVVARAASGTRHRRGSYAAHTAIADDLDDEPSWP